MKAEHILAINSPLMQFAIYTCILLISWFGSQMVLASGDVAGLGLTTGQLSSMFTYTTQILSALMMVSMVFVMITMSRAAAQRGVGAAGRAGAADLSGRRPDAGARRLHRF